jgi:ABC-type phosphate/phosphonate transport system substrate-binding protein
MFSPRRTSIRPVLSILSVLAAVVFSSAVGQGQSDKVAVLRIGSTGTLTGDADSPREKAGLDTLRSFIKEQTGMSNEIQGQQKWNLLADKMAKGELHLGVFQGYEFAWAQEKVPALKPLALGVNGERYPIACVVVKHDNAAKDFAGLKGQTLVMPQTTQGFLRLFVERQSELGNQKADAFFGKITRAADVEDALDNIVDGKGQAIVVDRSTLEAYKQRKPGRFSKLREVAHSQPFPPIVVAYCGTFLDQPTLLRFKDGLLGAAQKEKGETLLTLSHLTAFENVPPDFGQILAQTGKIYPHP